MGGDGGVDGVGVGGGVGDDGGSPEITDDGRSV